MLKFHIAIAAIFVGLMMATPASAHFSQVFSPFKALLTPASSVAQVKTECAGSYVGSINLDWISSN